LQIPELIQNFRLGAKGKTMASSAGYKNVRAFLSFLAASPILACAVHVPLVEIVAEPLPLRHGGLSAHKTTPSSSPVKEALNVFDFYAAARTKLSTAHYTSSRRILSITKRSAQIAKGFNKYELRMRRSDRLTKVDQSVRSSVLNWRSPIFLSPVAG